VYFYRGIGNNMAAVWVWESHERSRLWLTLVLSNHNWRFSSAGIC